MARTDRILKPTDEDVPGRILKTDPKLRLLSRQILRQQQRLRRELSIEGWQVYLRLEELMDARFAQLLEKLRARLGR